MLPLKVLQSDRASISKRKIKDVITKFKNLVYIAVLEPELTESSDCSNYQRLVHSLNKKLTDCSNKRKIQMLALTPEDWAIQKTVEFFHVSEHAVKQARKLTKEKGILTTPVELYER